MTTNDTFNVFVIGPMGLKAKDRAQILESGTNNNSHEFSKDDFVQEEHTIAIGKAIRNILDSAAAREFIPHGYKVEIPDKLPTGSIRSSVFNKIDNSDLIIADLHNNRPAVYYEMALAHSIGVPVFLLAKKDNGSAFYSNDTRTIIIDDYNTQSIEEALHPEIINLLQGVDPHGYRANPFNSFYGAPVVDISAAAGLAAGYFTNLVKDTIIQKQGVLRQSKCEKFYVIRLDDILDRDGDEDRLMKFMARVTGEQKAKLSDYDRRFERATWEGRYLYAKVAGNAIIDLPTPLYSLFNAPRYKRVLDRNGYDHPEARRMQQQMIDAFFRSLRRLIDGEEGLMRKQLEVVTFDELERRFGLKD